MVSADVRIFFFFFLAPPLNLRNIKRFYEAARFPNYRLCEPALLEDFQRERRDPHIMEGWGAFTPGPACSCFYLSAQRCPERVTRARLQGEATDRSLRTEVLARPPSAAGPCRAPWGSAVTPGGPPRQARILAGGNPVPRHPRSERLPSKAPWGPAEVW